MKSVHVRLIQIACLALLTSLTLSGCSNGEETVGFTETVKEALPVPLAGLTDSQAGAAESAAAVQLRDPPPLFDTAIVCVVGDEPSTTVKLKVAGVTAMVAGAEVTVNVTGMLCGVLVAPGADTVMDLL